MGEGLLYDTGFTYSLGRLMPRASKCRGPPNKVYDIFNIVIDLSCTCCYNLPGFCNFPCTPFQNNTVFMGVAMLSSSRHVAIHLNLPFFKNKSMLHFPTEIPCRYVS
jgi:hypothetical protein